MRVWFLVAVVGCGGASPRTVSNTGTDRPAPSPCGFTDFHELDAAAWHAAQAYKGGPPPEVGACRLHAIATNVHVLRDSALDVAEVTRDGTMLLVPGLVIHEFAVGMSSDVVLEKHPPDTFRISCSRSARHTTCNFVPVGLEVTAILEFAVDGDLPGRLEGVAAYEFFRNKTLRGVQLLNRVD
jgi:hypothetical protein